MDSLTQIALGATVSVAVMGRRTAVWKAALWGGVAGTLPDLDVLIDHGDAVLNMVLHRAESHALLYLALLSAPLGWLVARTHGQPQLLLRWWAAMALALLTHPLLDAMTIYGTQLWLPFTDEAVGVGSVFIIDPAYTLPLLLGVGWALSGHRWGLRANGVALGVGTAYLAWSVLAQAAVGQHARQSLQAAGLPTDRVLVTPAPLSTLLWRVVAMDGPRYHEGFYALADGARPIAFSAHDSGHDLATQHANHPQVQRLARFSDGFFRLKEEDGHLWLTDLRMGQEPHYSFVFDLGTPAQLDAGQTQPHKVSAVLSSGLDLAGLVDRMLGRDLRAPAATAHP